MLPAATGGANWQGGSFDPETERSTSSRTRMCSRSAWCQGSEALGHGLRHRRTRRSDPQRRRRPGCAAAAAVAPAAKAGGGLDGAGPAAGEAAVRTHHRDRSEQGRACVWQIAHGETPDNVQESSGAERADHSAHRTAGRIGTLVTKSLVIAGEGGFFTTPNGQRGAMLRAYDKATGKEAGAVYMPAPQTGSPMTYMLNGRQYIVVAISGSGLARRASCPEASGELRVAALSVG